MEQQAPGPPPPSPGAVGGAPGAPTGGAPPAQQQQQPQRQPPRVDYETVFTNAKAGMEGVDPEHVKRVVYEASKGTPHYENEQRKAAQTDAKIARMRAALAATPPAALAASEQRMDARLAELEAGRDLTRTWLHVDMDAFFAAVEELDRPELRSRPFAVGGVGMISTASYAARKYGVRSAMPGFIALKLCPHLLFVPPDFAKYQAASEATREIFRCYDPAFQAGSLDEAALDATAYCAAHGVSGEQVAAEIRARVQAQTRLTCSVGIASNRMLAKICSDRNKPNGQYALAPSRDAALAFMADLSIRKVPGVGKVAQRVLAAFGVHTGADLLAQRRLLGLEDLFSPLNADWLLRVALGLGETEHAPLPAEGEVGRKGISHERTFRALSRCADLEAKLSELAGALAEDMAAEGLRGRTLTLKLKHASFELRTRALTLPRHVCTASELYAAGLRLLHAELPCELRLLGLRVSNFQEPSKREPGQRSLEEVLAARGGASAASLPPAAHADADQQQGAEPGGECGAGEQEPHTSQLLEEGDLVELSLRDWQPAQSQHQRQQQQQHPQQQQQQTADGTSSPGGSSGWQGAEVSLPPSLATSPATAARYEREAAAAAAGGSHEPGETAAAAIGGAASGRMHLPPTGLDVMLRQAASKAAHLPQRGSSPEQQQQQQQQTGVPPAAPQQQQQTWACGACTFDNPKASFWCEVCGTSRLPPLRQPAAPGAAAASSKAPTGSSSKPGGSKPAGNSSKAGGSTGSGAGSSSSKGKRGRRPGTGAPPPGPSILRFVSARQPSPPAEPEPGPAQQQQQRRRQPAEPAEEHCQALPEAQQQAAAAAAVAAAESSEEEEAWEGEPESPLLPGEDLLECPACGEWVRSTRYQAHADGHMAARLQQEEDRLNRLFSRAPGGGAGAGSSGKKRAAAGKAGGSGGGRQGTLLAFTKRPKQ